MTEGPGQRRRSPAPRCTIVQTRVDGHRLWYVALLVGALRDADASVTLLVPEGARGSAEWSTFLGVRDLGGVSVVEVDDDPDAVLSRALTLPGPVVVPDGDTWLLRLLGQAVRRVRLEGNVLVMRPYRPAGIRPSLRYVVKRVVMVALGPLAPGLRVFRLAAGDEWERRADWLPDPVEFAPRATSRAAWLRQHDLDPALRYLVVLGDVSERKHSPELVRAIRGGAGGGVWHLVLVGRRDGPTDSALAEGAGSVHAFDGYVSDEDFDTWVLAADAIASVHRNEGSSGVVHKCRVAGTPVLVSGNRTARRFAAAAGGLVRPLARVTTESLDRCLGGIGARTAEPRPLSTVQTQAFCRGLLTGVLSQQRT